MRGGGESIPSNYSNFNKFQEILSRHQLAEFELGVYGNLYPEKVEEAIAIMLSSFLLKIKEEISIIKLCSMILLLFRSLSVFKVPSIFPFLGC